MTNWRVAGLLWLAWTGAAQADDTILYTTRAGDTLELVAAEFYGNRNLAAFLRATNPALASHKGGAPLRAGRRLRLPTTREIVAEPGDTFGSVAATYLGDARRGALLAMWNGSTEPAGIAAGSTIMLPVQVTHVVRRGETLATIASRYYEMGTGPAFDRGAYVATLLAYNYSLPAQASEAPLRPGLKLVVPMHQMQIRAQYVASAPSDAAAIERAAKREKMQARGEAARPRAEAAWERGDFASVKRELAGLDLEYLDVTEAVAIGLLLGSAYVAFGDNDSARATFAVVRAKRPDLGLSEYRYSPTVRAAWDAAVQPRKSAEEGE